MLPEAQAAEIDKIIDALITTDQAERLALAADGFQVEPGAVVADVDHHLGAPAHVVGEPVGRGACQEVLEVGRVQLPAEAIRVVLPGSGGGPPGLGLEVDRHQPRRPEVGVVPAAPEQVDVGVVVQVGIEGLPGRFDSLAVVLFQNMAQLAISWVLRHTGMTSALIGASKVWQIEEAVAALEHVKLGSEEQAAIEAILAE